jgi:tRNA wybutosine-synthesizing protein 2
VLAVRVEKGEAESVRRILLNRGVLDKRRKIIERRGWVEIPVSSNDGNYEYIRQRKPVFYRPRLSFKAVRDSLREKLRREELRRLKGGWELIGDVLILKMSEELDKEGKCIIAERFMDFIPKVKVVLNRGGIANPFREPISEVLAGTAGETIHKENGCRFKIDPSKVMFSTGNMGERRRMATIADNDEIVLDMFAGIGQFTIPMAKHSKPKRVLSIEKNPVAYSYLVENVKLNGLVNVTPILGDCREESPRGEVNRVIMGYFFDTLKFLPHALAALDAGGVIHFHDLVHRRKLDERAVELMDMVGAMGYALGRINPRIVKSYSPSRYHAVFDMEVK